MSAIEVLKSSCKGTVSFRNFREIDVGVYGIEQFKFVETKHGKKLVVRTDEFLCFLPDRCSKAITTDQQVAELNLGEWALKYDGRDVKRGNCILVDIIEKPKQPEWQWNEFLTLEDRNMEQNLTKQ